MKLGVDIHSIRKLFNKLHTFSMSLVKFILPFQNFDRFMIIMDHKLFRKMIVLLVL